MNDASSGQARTPALANLAVRRETYVDQKTTDEIIARLCEKAPDLIEELAEQERIVAPYHRDSTYADTSFQIEAWLRENELPSLDIDNGHLAIIDLLYETSRRTRLTQGLSDYPVLGKPLTTNANEPLPPLISLDVTDHPLTPITNEQADKICAIVYENNPDLMVSLVEQQRHTVASYAVEAELGKIMKDVGAQEGLEKMGAFSVELKRRLGTMSQTYTTDLKNEMRGP